MTKYFQKPFFRKLFLSYTAILLACSLVFSSILFQQILRQERSVQEQQCRSDAQLLMQVVDDKFTEIENIGTQLASAPVSYTHLRQSGPRRSPGWGAGCRCRQSCSKRAP